MFEKIMRIILKTWFVMFGAYWESESMFTYPPIKGFSDLIIAGRCFIRSAVSCTKGGITQTSIKTKKKMMVINIPTTASRRGAPFLTKKDISGRTALMIMKATKRERRRFFTAQRSARMRINMVVYTTVFGETSILYVLLSCILLWYQLR